MVSTRGAASCEPRLSVAFIVTHSTSADPSCAVCGVRRAACGRTASPDQ
ncbi:hypothetical protein RR46_03006 [Papilio xuthus]|uniref:Uncharacterized protein n=1 Tax=Papilio xuthus TaxID=66420 RepID=A0A194Q4E4_PAPXU|nr:hypothetical protein RR46_03006 [Papilio xuthus]